MVTPISLSSLAIYSHQNVLGQAAIERLDDALGVCGLRIQGRHHDIGDAEHDLLGRLGRLGLAGGVLGRAEDRGDGRLRKRRRNLARA